MEVLYSQVKVRYIDGENSRMLRMKNYINIFFKIFIIILFIFSLNFFFIYSVAYNNNAFEGTKLNINTIVEFYKKNLLLYNDQNVNNKRLSFMQDKYYTCGPAAAKYILYYYGITASEKELEELMNTTEDGSSLYAMQNTINSYGLSSKGLLVNYSRLSEIRMPVIAFVKNNHYVVIKRVTDRYVHVFDPDPKYANFKLSRETFLNVWGGVILKVNVKSNK